MFSRTSKFCCLKATVNFSRLSSLGTPIFFQVGGVTTFLLESRWATSGQKRALSEVAARTLKSDKTRAVMMGKFMVVQAGIATEECRSYG